MEIALFEPEIPPNTGNVIRLCANTGARLHLIHPLAFDISDKRLRRAGLDYAEFANVVEHANWDEFKSHVGHRRLLGFSTKGVTRYDQTAYAMDDVLLFGPETRGLPDHVLNSLDACCQLRIPMRPNNRSMNLSNAVAIALYEAWRQAGFSGGE